MSLFGYFNGDQLSSMLRASNYWASKNRNRYPEKIENAIKELYEWVDCQCDENCECKEHGCKKHLVRKGDIDFERHYHHFLNCYVDRRAHEAVRKGRKSGRGYRAIEATNIIQSKWDLGFSFSKMNKSLLCTDWSYGAYLELSKNFKPGSENIYLSKWMTLLSMGTYVAYDNGSISLLMRDYNKPNTYYELLRCIRSELIIHLKKNKKSIMDFCLYDNPNEFYKNIPANSFRPIGNIIDKLYLML